MANKILNQSFIVESPNFAKAGAQVIVDQIENPKDQDISQLMETAIKSKSTFYNMDHYQIETKRSQESNSAFLTLLAKEQHFRDNREQVIEKHVEEIMTPNKTDRLKNEDEQI